MNNFSKMINTVFENDIFGLGLFLNCNICYDLCIMFEFSMVHVNYLMTLPGKIRSQSGWIWPQTPIVFTLTTIITFSHL